MGIKILILLQINALAELGGGLNTVVCHDTVSVNLILKIKHKNSFKQNCIVFNMQSGENTTKDCHRLLLSSK